MATAVATACIVALLAVSSAESAPMRPGLPVAPPTVASPAVTEAREAAARAWERQREAVRRHLLREYPPGCESFDDRPPRLHTYFRFTLAAAQGEIPAHVKSEHRRVPRAAATALKAALIEGQEELEACLDDETKPAWVDVGLVPMSSPEIENHGGLTERERACTRTVVERLVGDAVDEGALTLRLIFDRPADRPSHRVISPLSTGWVRRADKVIRNDLELQTCYDSVIEGWPELSGRVTIRAKVGPQGNVRAASVHNSELGNRPLECCIVRRFRTLTLPPNKRVTLLDAPIEFLQTQ